MPKTPIFYTAVMPARFSDFDLLGHVNSIRLIQMVMDARYEYFASRWKMPLSSICPDGVALYTTKVACNFRRSIQNFGNLKFESHVNESIGPVVRVRFTVTSEETGTVHADGQIEQVFVDTATQSFLDRMPEAVLPYIFEETQ